MANTPTMRRWGLLSLVGGVSLVAAATAVIGLIPSSNVVSQVSGSVNNSTATVVTSYNATYINQVIPGTTAEKLEEIIPFPEQPAMFVRTEKALTLWVRQDDQLRSLMEIPLDSGTNSLQFLEDNSTFIVLSKKRARVFALNKVQTVVTAKK